MRIKIISELRKYDAAIMELGLEYTDKMAIPPGIIAYPLSGYCISECTEIVNRILYIDILLLFKLLLLMSIHFVKGFTKTWNNNIWFTITYTFKRYTCYNTTFS